jgi:hypothetical protein
MPYNGSGTFNVYTPGNPVVTGTTISSTWANNTLSDLATGLSTAITKNGQTTVTANIPFSGYKLTGVGAATLRTDAATLANIQDGTGVYVATVGGTADAITLTPSPAIAAYAVGQRFVFVPGAANTGAATVNVSGLGAGALQKGGVALGAGAIANGSPVEVLVTAATPVFEIVGTGSYVGSGSITTSGLTMNTARMLLRTTAGTGAIEEGLIPYFPGIKQGLTLSNNVSDATNDIDVAAGKAVDTTGAVVMSLASLMVKRLDADWAAGTNQGGRYSGAAIANTTYHVWLVSKAAGADVDVYLDPSEVPATVLAHLQAESGGADYLYLWRINSIVRRSAAIKGFTQLRSRMLWAAPELDISVTNPGTSAVTRTLIVPVGVPVIAHFSARALGDSAGAPGSTYFSPLDSTDVAASSTGVGLVHCGGSLTSASDGMGQYFVKTNTSGQIRSRAQNSAAGTALYVSTVGWIDDSIYGA